jgi:class 3 adenylate cyclase
MEAMSRWAADDELLLVLLRLLEQRPMTARELLAETGRLLGSQASGGRILVALDSLEAETLVDVTERGERTEYGITATGREAVQARADVTVLPSPRRAGRPRLPGRRELTPEPEQVAVLFTDVVRSTEMLYRLGDEAAHGVRRRHFELLRNVVREHEGREVKSLGDGLMVVFDTPQLAAVAGLAMQRAVAACEDDIELRVGIASGETVREDDDYFGRPVVVAKRLCDAAAPGETLVAGPARGLMADASVERESRGPLKLKGLSEPVTPTALRAPAQAAEG